MPGLPVHVLSLVPEDGVDIRDGADVGLERLEALRFRARLFDIGALALAGTGILLAVAAVVAVIGRARATEARGPARVSDRRALGAAQTALADIARESAGGWSPELVSAGHAALRVVAARAIGRPLSEQPLAPGASPSEGRLPVRALFPGRPAAAVGSATTAADVGRVLDSMSADASIQQRAGLETLRAALVTFTRAQYSAADSPDAVTLTEAVHAGRAEAARLARERLWPWRRRVDATVWREGATRS
jgi:hypothetical protein